MLCQFGIGFSLLAALRVYPTLYVNALHSHLTPDLHQRRGICATLGANSYPRTGYVHIVLLENTRKTAGTIAVHTAPLVKQQRR